jgi:DNA-binding transcriptional LysR family regulator
LVRKEAKSGQLVVKQTLEPKPGLSMFVVWRSADRGKALRWFIDRLEDRKLADSLLA